jgi:hypothetical protein
MHERWPFDVARSRPDRQPVWKTAASSARSNLDDRWFADLVLGPTEGGHPLRPQHDPVRSDIAYLKPPERTASMEDLSPSNADVGSGKLSFVAMPDAAAPTFRAAELASCAGHREVPLFTQSLTPFPPFHRRERFS